MEFVVLVLSCILTQYLLGHVKISTEMKRENFFKKKYKILTGQFEVLVLLCVHGKCPKILYTKFFHKMAHATSTDPDQIAPKGPI